MPLAVRTATQFKRRLHTGSSRQLIESVRNRSIGVHALERHTNTATAVAVRRAYYERQVGVDMTQIPSGPESIIQEAHGRSCENMIGTLPVPMGIVGPLRVDGIDRYVPFATTEGALVASLNRGAKALTAAGGVTTVTTPQGVTRAPLVRLADITQVHEVEKWLSNSTNWEACCAAYATTTNHGSLQGVDVIQSGNYAHLRFRALTGNAMGMNGISKGVVQVMKSLEEAFPTMEVLSYSGNACTDKKASAMNWIKGRSHKSVAEARISVDILRDILGVSACDFDRIHTQKNLVGSALAGTIGGNNAHAANAIGGLFLATGQDIAQVGTSSFAITNCEREDSTSLRFGVTMPSLEVATIGGGTNLSPQNASLRIMNIDPNSDGASSTLASIAASLVLAGEISLLAAHATNDLVKAHMRLGRGGSKT